MSDDNFNIVQKFFKDFGKIAWVAIVVTILSCIFGGVLAVAVIRYIWIAAGS